MNQGIRCDTDVWNTFYLMSCLDIWSGPNNHNPSSPQSSPCQSHKPAGLRACTPIDPLSLQLPPRYHTELLSKDLPVFFQKKSHVSPMVPQMHKLIEACAWRMIHLQRIVERKTKNKTYACNFLFVKRKAAVILCPQSSDTFFCTVWGSKEKSKLPY